MMDKAKLIVPPHYIKPPCEAKTKDIKGGGKCHNLASIKINNKCLCKRHAEVMALDILLKEGEAQQ